MFVCKTRHLVLAGGSKVGVSLAASHVSPVPAPRVVTLVSCPPSAQRRHQLHGGGFRSNESSDQQPHAPRRGRWVRNVPVCQCGESKCGSNVSALLLQGLLKEGVEEEARCGVGGDDGTMS